VLFAAYFVGPRILATAFVGAGLGMYLFYQGFRLLARRRLILNTPTSKIRSASMGIVELTGLAVGPYTLTAPFTGMPCYYHRSIAWEWRSSGRSNEWQKVLDESSHVSFFIDDNTGRMLVDPQGAEMDLHRDFHQEYSESVFSSGPEMPPNVTRFLALHGVSANKKIKVEEYCIKPKNALFVLGTLAENQDAGITSAPVRNESQLSHTISIGQTTIKMVVDEFLDPGKLTAGTQEVVFLSPEAKPSGTGELSQQSKIAAAMMKAGITNPAAWAAAGVQYPGAAAAVSAAVAPVTSLEEFDLHPKTVLRKGEHGEVFMISWRSQRDVLQSLGWKSALMIWGGPALTLISLYIIAVQFGWL
jgi:hypothetical protein